MDDSPHMKESWKVAEQSTLDVFLLFLGIVLSLRLVRWEVVNTKIYPLFSSKISSRPFYTHSATGRSSQEPG